MATINRHIPNIRTTALLLSLLLIIIYIAGASAGVQTLSPAAVHDCSPTSVPSFAAGIPILTYQFFHANIFHLLTNVWSFLIITFFWHIRYRELIISYLASILCGYLIQQGVIPTPAPVIGFSSVIYALLGCRAFAHLSSLHRNTSKPSHIPSCVLSCLRYNLYILLSISVTLLFPKVAVTTHLTCYAITALYSHLSTPIFTPQSPKTAVHGCSPTSVPPASAGKTPQKADASAHPASVLPRPRQA